MNRLKLYSEEIDKFIRIESAFAVGLMQITGCTMSTSNAIKEQMRQSICMIEEMLKQVDAYVQSDQDASHFVVLRDENSEDLLSEFNKLLEEESPIVAAVHRVISDLCIRYPALSKEKLTPIVMMDRDQNDLYACFPRLVGVDWNMSRRMSGTKVTYASDYNRMANQYRTTTFAFKRACVQVDADNKVKLVLARA